MKEPNFIIANAKIWDKFDLPIQEDIEDLSFYTINEIRQEVEKRIAKLATLGAYYAISPAYITDYEIVEARDSIAGVEPVGEHKYLFKISKLAARKRNEKYLDTVIYHELCHILQVECLVTLGLMYYLDDGLVYDTSKKAAVATWFYKDDYHTDIWYTFVNKINSNFEINPLIARFLDTKDEVDIFLESTFKPDTFIVAKKNIMDYRRCVKRQSEAAEEIEEEDNIETK